MEVVYVRGIYIHINTYLFESHFYRYAGEQNYQKAKSMHVQMLPSQLMVCSDGTKIPGHGAKNQNCQFH